VISRTLEVLSNLDTKQLLYGAAGLSIAAAVIHGLVTPDHFEEWWGYGLFFLVASLGQLFYGLLLIFQPWQPDPIRGLKRFSVRWLYIIGIVANTCIIGLYVFTRIIGIPFLGPEAWEVEDVTILSQLRKELR
jgi:hypothetical protein